MKKILVPFDFSKPAIDAFRFALDIGSDLKSVLHLLHVIELPVLGDAGAMSVLAFEEHFLNELREKAATQFQKITEKYKSEHVKVTWDVVFGAPSNKIVNAIKDQQIDLVIMGSHGASGLREYLLGSNAEKIIRKSPVPVFIIKSYTKRSIQNIVFPNALDLYDQQDLIIKVKTLQKLFKAHLHIVWINTPLNFTSDVITKQRLHEFAHHYKLTDYTTNVFNHRNEQEGIIEFSKSVNGDLIAIGTHGRKGMSHVINGSLAEDVANHSTTIVWTYASKDEHVSVTNE